MKRIEFSNIHPEYSFILGIRIQTVYLLTGGSMRAGEFNSRASGAANVEAGSWAKRWFPSLS